MRLSAKTEYQTETAELSMKKLCRHFAHKLPVVLDSPVSEIVFPFGQCKLIATDGALQLSVMADNAEQLTKVGEVVLNHLQRFAKDDSVRELEWH